MFQETLNGEKFLYALSRHITTTMLTSLARSPLPHINSAHIHIELTDFSLLPDLLAALSFFAHVVF
jgi:hypothetical protein